MQTANKQGSLRHTNILQIWCFEECTAFSRCFLFFVSGWFHWAEPREREPQSKRDTKPGPMCRNSLWGLLSFNIDMGFGSREWWTTGLSLRYVDRHRMLDWSTEVRTLTNSKKRPQGSSPYGVLQNVVRTRVKCCSLHGGYSLCSLPAKLAHVSGFNVMPDRCLCSEDIFMVKYHS